LLKGIRFDAATQIANNEFLKIVAQQSKEQARARYIKYFYLSNAHLFPLFSGFGTEFYCVGEYLPDKVEYVKSNGGPMDGIWHDSFYRKIREAIVTETVNWQDLKDVIDPRRKGYKNIADVVNYQSNHDHDRFLVELG
jgi:1,4-alpha-glucan branching enzyme